MKYILSFIFIILVSISSLWNNTYANTLFNWGDKLEIPYCQSGDDCGLENWVKAIKNIDGIESTRTASVYIQDIVKYILTFLTLIATIIIIYAWFNLLTWVGDEEKAKKTKSIIIYAIIWLLIIFAAGPIIDFVLNILKA